MREAIPREESVERAGGGIIEPTITVERDKFGIAWFNSDYKTAEQRKREGKDRRGEIPRESLAEFELPGDRPDPVEVIEESGKGRLEHLVPIRYGRMSKSVLAFFRGTSSLNAMDSAGTPMTGITVQACGDCHLSNFGLFATPERNLIFDINDFDETLPASFEYDIKRLAASFFIAALHNGCSDKDGKTITRTCARAYREGIAKFSTMTVLDVWYARLDAETLIASAPDADARKIRQAIADEAKESIGDYVFPKITQVIHGRRRLIDQAPLLYHPPPEEKIPENVVTAIANYRETLPYDRRLLFNRYRIEDFAYKVVGVGSVGTRCGVALFMAEENDSLFLQVKEAGPSVLEPYAGKSEFPHHGQRVVIGQRLMQSASDMMLGWTTTKKGLHFYVRQLRDMKYSPNVSGMTPLQLSRYAEICGLTLARAHARSGDASMIFGYLGKSDVFDRAIGTFARLYAYQAERDWKRFLGAIHAGRITADYEK